MSEQHPPILVRDLDLVQSQRENMSEQELNSWAFWCPTMKRYTTLGTMEVRDLGTDRDRGTLTRMRARPSGMTNELRPNANVRGNRMAAKPSQLRDSELWDGSQDFIQGYERQRLEGNTATTRPFFIESNHIFSPPSVDENHATNTPQLPRLTRRAHTAPMSTEGMITNANMRRFRDAAMRPNERDNELTLVDFTGATTDANEGLIRFGSEHDHPLNNPNRKNTRFTRANTRVTRRDMDWMGVPDTGKSPTRGFGLARSKASSSALPKVSTEESRAAALAVGGSNTHGHHRYHELQVKGDHNRDKSYNQHLTPSTRRRDSKLMYSQQPQEVVDSAEHVAPTVIMQTRKTAYLPRAPTHTLDLLKEDTNVPFGSAVIMSRRKQDLQLAPKHVETREDFEHPTSAPIVTTHRSNPLSENPHWFKQHLIPENENETFGGLPSHGVYGRSVNTLSDAPKHRDDVLEFEDPLSVKIALTGANRLEETRLDEMHKRTILNSMEDDSRNFVVPTVSRRDSALRTQSHRQVLDENPSPFEAFMTVLTDRQPEKVKIQTGTLENINIQPGHNIKDSRTALLAPHRTVFDLSDVSKLGSRNALGEAFRVVGGNTKLADRENLLEPSDGALSVAMDRFRF